jgi:hypothetical protein
MSIRVTVSGSWNWDEFHHAVQRVRQIMTDSHEPMILVADFLQTKGLPLGSGAVSNAASASKGMPPTWVGTVIITQNSFIRTLVSIFQQTFRSGMGAKFHTVTSPEQAEQLVERLLSVRDEQRF